MRGRYRALKKPLGKFVLFLPNFRVGFQKMIFTCALRQAQIIFIIRLEIQQKSSQIKWFWLVGVSKIKTSETVRI
jgi:hypothetical protein